MVAVGASAVLVGASVPLPALTVVVVALAVTGVVGWVLVEPGPSAVLVLVRRYSVWPAVFVAMAAAAAAGAVVAPVRTAQLAIFAACWTVAAGIWARWSPATVGRATRRLVLRARWPSVARAAGSGTTSDRRSSEWPGGSTVTVASQRVEHLPQIAHGRALPDGRGVRYRLRPARGGRLQDVEARAEQLAAGLAVARVLVEREAPHRGALVVLWSDPLAAARDAPDEQETAA